MKFPEVVNHDDGVCLCCASIATANNLLSFAVTMESRLNTLAKVTMSLMHMLVQVSVGRKDSRTVKYGAALCDGYPQK